jgi:hypothetical protein
MLLKNRLPVSLMLIAAAEAQRWATGTQTPQSPNPL